MSSGGGSKLFGRGEEFLAVFKRGAEFTRELLGENERLRRRLATLESRQQSAALDPDDWNDLRGQLMQRIHSLEEQYESVTARLEEVEEENKHFADRYVEIEEENNNLANLYVVSYQLHSTLDLDEVLKIIIEIVINLVGAELFAVYLLDERSRTLGVVAAEGEDPAKFPSFELGSGVVGKSVLANETHCEDGARSGGLGEPIVCIPLVVQDQPIGAIAVHRLLQHKEGFSPLDHELFTLLGGHAATAIFAAKLYSQSERKLTTIQGFIDLLTK